MSVQMYFDDSEGLKHWGLNTDVVCEHCGKLNYYPGMWAFVKCIACYKQCEFPVAFIDGIPIIFNNEEQSEDFEKEFESLKIACNILERKFTMSHYLHDKRLMLHINIYLEEKEETFLMRVFTTETTKFKKILIHQDKNSSATTDFKEAFKLAKEAI